METLIQMLYRGSTFKLQNTWFSDTSKKFLQKIYNDLNNTVVPDFNIDNNTGTKYGEHFDDIPDNIRSYISKTKFLCNTVTTKINTKNVTIHIMHPHKLVNDMIPLLLKWLTYAYSISPDKCSQQLRIFIYLTPFKKTIPTMDAIDRSHANNAFTFACAENNEINIYRNEEWFKVFIHETIHALGIDFSRFSHGRITNPVLKEIYNVNIDFHLHEAYCETLATILNLCLKHQHHSFNVFYRNLQRKLFNEALFSLYQSAKLLNHHNVQYKQLVRTRKSQIYNEKTPLFSYFIIKSCLMYHGDAFIMYLNSHGIVFHEKYLSSFLDLIKRLANKQPFISDLTKMQELLGGPLHHHLNFNNDLISSHITGFTHSQSKSLRFSLYG